MAKLLAAFVLAALAGLAIGWSTSGNRDASGAEASQEPPPRERPRPEATKEAAIDLAKHRAVERSHPDFNPIAAELADWTNDEIRAALEESLVHPEAALHFGGGGPYTSFLLKEWIRRDFDEVLAWFSRAPSSTRTQIARSLTIYWPAQRAGEGLDFVLKNRDWFPSAPWALVLKSIEQEAANGAAAVGGLLQLFHQEEFNLNAANPIHFPPGFDFSTLAASEGFDAIQDTVVGGVILHAWFAQDRQQEAFEWVLENQGPDGLPPLLRNPFTGGSAKDVAWIAGNVERLEPETRTAFIDTMIPTWLSSPFKLIWFADGVTDPGFLTEVRGVAPQLVFGGYAHQAIPLLEAVPDPTERIRLLENASPDDLYERAYHQRRFPETDEALLRKKLTEWNATEPQIESIISRFKP